ncbi:MAG TPA: PDZ domain-containing protein [Pirellulaceae bacterium]|nr:PDZ domain-containing protein [Pirellulaceae bacterium]
MTLRAATLLGFAWVYAATLAAAPAQAQSTILAAFRDVVKETSKCTVEVYAKDRKSKDRLSLGAIVAADGYVLTKASEARGEVACLLSDGRRLDARVVGVDKNTDLALLKIEAKDLPTIQWREGDAPAVGSWLATPGFADSRPSTYPIATGVVSVGPRKIASPPAAMGVNLDAREDMALVESVRENTPAEQAGVVAGDIIRKVNDKEIKGRIDLVTTIRKLQPGDKVRLLIERDGQEVTIDVVLASLAVIAQEGLDRADFQNHLGGELSERRAGFPSALQHDTVLRPSDCGGPVVDLEGKVVGINIARAGRVESYAIPAGVIKTLLPDLMSGKLDPNPQTDTVAGGTQPVTEEEKKVQ